MPLDINEIIDVSASIVAQGAPRREFGIGIFITSSNKVSASGAERIRTFANQSEIADASDSTDAPYLAGSSWFSQVPRPKNLMIAGFSKVRRDTVITGTRVTSSLSDFQAITNASISFDGNNAGGADFSSAGSLADVATTIQGLIRATSPDFSMTYDSNAQAFVITIDTTSSVSAVADGGMMSVAEGNENHSAMFGLAPPANYALGSAGETITEALDEIADLDDGFYYVLPDHASIDDDDLLAIGAWAESRSNLVVADVTGASILASNENTSIAAQMAALEYGRTSLVWSSSTDYKATSIAARLSSWNPSAPASLPTAKFKSLPGRLADDITTTQKRELDRKMVNHYSPYGTVNIFAEGQTLKAGSWMDVVLWLDWFVDAERKALFNLLVSTPTRIPQTDRGAAAIIEVVTGICEQGVRNGGIAGGVVSPALADVIRRTTGNDDFDGTLSTGYLVHVDPFALQDQTDRDARRSSPVFIALKGSGAIHSAEVTINFEN